MNKRQNSKNAEVRYVDREVKVDVVPRWIPPTKFKPGDHAYTLTYDYDRTKVPCEFCGGSGGVIANGNPKSCPLCKGEGKKPRDLRMPKVTPCVIHCVELYCWNDHGFAKYWTSYCGQDHETKEESIFATVDEADVACAAELTKRES
jgi:hypothetical protein